MDKTNGFTGAFGREVFDSDNRLIGIIEKGPGGVSFVVDETGQTIGEVIDHASDFDNGVLSISEFD